MTSTDKDGRHVFISYVREDTSAVDLLQARLEAAGIRVWRDTQALSPGQGWEDRIRRAIRNDSLAFLACFSTKSVSRSRSYQYKELRIAVDEVQLRKPDVPWLIPVRFDACEIPDIDIGGSRTLASIQRVDLFGDGREKAYDQLVQQMLAAQSGAPDDSPSLREEAERLARMRPVDAARVLEETSVGAAAAVLKVILEDNEAQAVAILAQVPRNKAQELIAAVGAAPEWLLQLPTAAGAINNREKRCRSVLGASAGSLARSGPSLAGTQGYRQDYENGHIHWTARSGAQATAGAIGECYVAMGGSDGLLGFPVTAELDAKPSPFFGTTGRCQRFESSAAYGPEVTKPAGLSFGATIYWSAEHGAYATRGGIGEFYEQAGGTGGWLGFPKSDEVEAGPSSRDDGKGTTGACQQFEGGSVYISQKMGAIAVPRRIAGHLEHQHPNAADSLGFPVSPELPAGRSPYGTEGQLQRFEGRGGATIYTSEAHGTHCVGSDNGILYDRLGGTTSWLGFPKSDETETRVGEDEPLLAIQEFEGGVIVRSAGQGPEAIPKTAIEYLSEHVIQNSHNIWRTILTIAISAIIAAVLGFVAGVFLVSHKTVERGVGPPPPVSVITNLMTQDVNAAINRDPALAGRIYADDAVVTDAGCRTARRTWSTPSEIEARYQSLPRFKVLEHINPVVQFMPDNSRADKASATAETFAETNPRNPSHRPVTTHSWERWTFERLPGRGWVIKSFTFDICFS